MKNEKQFEIPHCVQCGKEMPYGREWAKFVPVCYNPECPNFGLLKMGIENIRSIGKK